MYLTNAGWTSENLSEGKSRIVPPTGEFHSLPWGCLNGVSGFQANKIQGIAYNLLGLKCTARADDLLWQT
eukprot:5088-Eustigmatos_ZCMA.PRE.1